MVGQSLIWSYLHPTSSCSLRHCSIEAVIFASAIEAWGFGLEYELGFSKHLLSTICRFWQLPDSRVKCSCRLHTGQRRTAFCNQYKMVSQTQLPARADALHCAAQAAMQLETSIRPKKRHCVAWIPSVSSSGFCLQIEACRWNMMEQVVAKC